MGVPTDDLNIKKKRGLKNVLKSGNPLSLQLILELLLYRSKLEANQSNLTITQSRNIQIYVFETSLIQL